MDVESREAGDLVRGPESAHLIVEFGDYECPYSRLAYRQIQQVEDRFGGQIRFAWRHFPLTDIHPHALAASLAAEAAGQHRRGSSTASSTAAPIPATPIERLISS
jgi:protein-disulfide isomerase